MQLYYCQKLSGAKMKTVIALAVLLGLAACSPDVGPTREQVRASTATKTCLDLCPKGVSQMSLDYGKITCECQK